MLLDLKQILDQTTKTPGKLLTVLINSQRNFRTLTIALVTIRSVESHQVPPNSRLDRQS